jgi:hypothetical protein
VTTQEVAAPTTDFQATPEKGYFNPAQVWVHPK